MSNFLTMLCYNFFRLILVFFHFAYSGFQYFDSKYTLLKRKLKNTIQLDYFDAQLFVSRFVNTLEKCPSHLLVIVGTDGINVEDFSNIVTWCLAAKISFVSFYDYSGYLKANQNIYYKYLIDKKKLDPKCLTFDFIKSNPKNKILHRIHLNILSLEDGKPLFIQLAKNLTEKILSKELEITGINETIINEKLYELSGIPEPELGVISGKICSTFGFSPWHVRVTEFLNHVYQFHKLLAITTVKNARNTMIVSKAPLLPETTPKFHQLLVSSMLRQKEKKSKLSINPKTLASKKFKRNSGIRIYFTIKKVFILHSEIRKIR